MAEEVEHVGTKTLTLLFGVLLSFIYAVMRFFHSGFNLSLADLSNIALVTVFFGFVFAAIIFFAQVFWTYMHKIGEKFW